MAPAAIPPVTGSSGPFPNPEPRELPPLTVAVRDAIVAALEQHGNPSPTSGCHRAADGAVAAVCKHLRDASPHHAAGGLAFDELDERLSAAIDDYLSGAPAAGSAG